MTPAQQTRYFEGLVHGVNLALGTGWAVQSDPYRIEVLEPGGDVVAWLLRSVADQRNMQLLILDLDLDLDLVQDETEEAPDV